jgi:hypothetical protein
MRTGKFYLPYSSSGITLYGMRTVQADSYFDCELIDFLFIRVGGRKGALGGGWSFLAGGPKITGGCQNFFLMPPV